MIQTIGERHDILYGHANRFKHSVEVRLQGTTVNFWNQSLLRPASLLNPDSWGIQIRILHRFHDWRHDLSWSICTPSPCTPSDRCIDRIRSWFGCWQNWQTLRRAIGRFGFIQMSVNRCCQTRFHHMGRIVCPSRRNDRPTIWNQKSEMTMRRHFRQLYVPDSEACWIPSLLSESLP